MKIKFLKKRENKRELKNKRLFEEYKLGKILQIDNGVNNKDYFKSLETSGNGPKQCEK